MTGIIGIVIGVLVAAFGLYYLIKEGKNAESRRIYGIACAAGAVVAAAAAALAINGL